MRNIKLNIDDSNKLIMEIDLSYHGAPSGTGKTIVIASSLGAQSIAANVYLNINVYKYVEDEPEKGV